MAETIEMPFGLWTQMGPKNHVGWGFRSPQVKGIILRGKLADPGGRHRYTVYMPIGVYYGCTLAQPGEYDLTVRVWPQKISSSLDM